MNLALGGKASGTVLVYTEQVNRVKIMEIFSPVNALILGGDFAKGTI